MQTLAIDPRILRTLVGPDIKVVPGRAMMARVVAANPGGRGTLSIAGYLLEAELPEEIQAGMDLRLLVRDVTSERVVLSLSEEHATEETAEPPARAPGPSSQAAATPPTPPAAPSIPLPGGGTVVVTERDAGGAGGRSPGSQSLALRFQAPALGAMDLRLELDRSSLRVHVTVSPGTALALAQADGDKLRQALGDELQRAVSVTITPRHQPVDVYA